MLIISSKVGLEDWEKCARNYYSSSFHSYTSSLSQRRKFGAARLGTFDAVITTLGVLAAKECSIPAFALTDDAGYDSNEEDLRDGIFDDSIGGEDWLRRRRRGNMTIE